MFELVLVITLLVAGYRSARHVFLLGLFSALAGVSLVVGAGWSALASGAGKGDMAVPIGVFFAGPGSILHERSGPLAFLSWPLAIAAFLLSSSVASLVVASSRHAQLYPEAVEAKRLSGIVAAFIGVATLATIKLIIALMYRALVGPD